MSRSERTHSLTHLLTHSPTPLQVREGGLVQILACARFNDLEVQRDCIFALANISDTPEYQADVVREGGIQVLRDLGTHDDARVQRHCARGMANLAVGEWRGREYVRALVIEGVQRCVMRKVRVCASVIFCACHCMSVS